MRRVATNVRDSGSRAAASRTAATSRTTCCCDLVRSLLGLPSAAAARRRITRGELDATARRACSGERGRGHRGPTSPTSSTCRSTPSEADRARRSTRTPCRAATAARRIGSCAPCPRQRPVVLVCEDIHWADPASVEVIRMVMPLAAQLPVLFIGALRAETDSAGWELVDQARDRPFGEALTEIRLEPLAEAPTAATSSPTCSSSSRCPTACATSSWPAPRATRSSSRRSCGCSSSAGSSSGARATAGSPRRASSSVEIPDTLHGLLLARIDQLPD